eukprot:TRINITY_DN3061_c0_g2_i2.p1 TRINITY_DN3061_c0_g2~~TRINITY_DN3061_c0_g2_i2.p1  ORF type:complete len:942 (-),score=264.78 TRINITY_DN3061_c0_g2_i2:55-2880(-)
MKEEERERKAQQDREETERALRELDKKYRELDGKYKVLEQKEKERNSSESEGEENKRDHEKHATINDVDSKSEDHVESSGLWKEKGSLSISIPSTQHLRKEEVETSDPSELPQDIKSSPSNSPRGEHQLSAIAPLVVNSIPISSLEEKIEVPGISNNLLNVASPSLPSMINNDSPPPTISKRGEGETEEETLARKRKEAEERVRLRIAKMEEERKAKRASLSALRPISSNGSSSPPDLSPRREMPSLSEIAVSELQVAKEVKKAEEEKPATTSLTGMRTAVSYEDGAASSTDSGEELKRSLDNLEEQLSSRLGNEERSKDTWRLRENRPRKSSLPPTVTPGLDSPTRNEYRKRLEDERNQKLEEEERRKVEEIVQIQKEERQKRWSTGLDAEMMEEYRKKMEDERIMREEEESDQISTEERQRRSSRENGQNRHSPRSNGEKSMTSNDLEDAVSKRIAAENSRTSKVHVEQLSNTNLFSTPDRNFDQDMQAYASKLQSQTNLLERSHKKPLNNEDIVRKKMEKDDSFLLKSGEVEPFLVNSSQNERVAELILEEDFSGSPIARRPTENRYLLKYLEPKKGKKSSHYATSSPAMTNNPAVKEIDLPDLDLDVSFDTTSEISNRIKPTTFGNSSSIKSHSSSSSRNHRPKSKIFDVRISNDLVKSAPLELLAQQQSALQNVVYYDVHEKKSPSDQNNICHNCYAKLETGLFSPKPRYCEYTGKYFCRNCHTNQKSIIPARILQYWDFKPYPVSDASLSHLETTLDEPIYDIASINSSLFYKVPNLRNVKILRRQLFYLKDYILNCDRVSQEKVMKELNGRLHVIHNTDIYSLRDLIELNTDQLVEWIRELTERFIIHVTKCQFCKSRGSQCGICKDPKVIYLFNVRTVTECKRCHTAFHRTCRKKENSCPVCQRLDFIAGSPGLKKLSLSPDVSPQSIHLNKF